MLEGSEVVVDASVIVDLVTDSPRAPGIAEMLGHRRLHAPAHVDAEVLSALGRLERAGAMTPRAARRALMRATSTPLDRSPLPELMEGAWRRRKHLRISDALYVELADRLGIPFLTSDQRLGRAHPAAVVVAGDPPA